MADVEFNFKDNRIVVKRAMSTAVGKCLLETSAEVVSQVARNTAVDTGQLKGSWAANITEGSDESVATIGSPLENAIWEEFGTGVQALNGDGRQDWTGKRPRRAFYKAYTTLKNKIIKHCQDVLGAEMS